MPKISRVEYLILIPIQLIIKFDHLVPSSTFLNPFRFTLCLRSTHYTNFEYAPAPSPPPSSGERPTTIQVSGDGGDRRARSTTTTSRGDDDVPTVVVLRSTSPPPCLAMSCLVLVGMNGQSPGISISSSQSSSWPRSKPLEY